MAYRFWSPGSSYFLVLASCLAGLQLEDGDEADTQPVAVETPEIKKELKSSNFPSIEGDTAPHAIVPKACQSIQKQVAKLESLVEAFNGAESLSQLQSRILA